MDPHLAFLTQRVYRLEQELERLKRAPLEPLPKLVDTPAAKAAPREVPHAAATFAAHPEAGRPAPLPRELEAAVVGTWFARIGAIALLIGAGFAFKYGIDRGIIGPGARVASGIAAGLLLIGVGFWARGRGWPVLAQAVAGAGIGLLYLSFWAGFHLYDLISAPVTFVALTAIAAASAAIAYAERWEPLAVIATIGGFLNPLIVGGADEPGALFGYLLVLDAAVLVLSAARRWPSLAFIAFGGTWLLFSGAAEDASTAAAFAYASALFALFGLRAAADLRRGEDRAETLALAVVNGLVYFGAGIALLSRDADTSRGAFAAALAALHLWGAWAMSHKRDASYTLSVLGQIFLAGAIGYQWEGLPVAAGWTIQAVAFIFLGTRGFPLGREGGVVMMIVALGRSVLVEFELGAAYRPEELLASTESLVLVVQIVALYAAGLLLGSGREEDRPAAGVAIIAANALTVMWISFEAVGKVAAGGEIIGRRSQPLQFSLSAIWGLYAAVLLAIGVAMRAKLARLMAIALFGITIGKMVIVDLWLLETGYRVLAFLGLGGMLLLASLTYHRFRELIFGDDEPEKTG